MTLKNIQEAYPYVYRHLFFVLQAHSMTSNHDGSVSFLFTDKEKKDLSVREIEELEQELLLREPAKKVNAEKMERIISEFKDSLKKLKPLL